ncbi:MAG: hypothetical protein WAX69_12165, partial [Victivallales bacterium]
MSCNRMSGFLLSILLGCCGVVAGDLEDGNLILDSGFEKWSGQQKFEIGKECQGWTIAEAYPLSVDVIDDADLARSGEKCLGLRPLTDKEIADKQLKAHIPGRGYLGHTLSTVTPQPGKIYEFGVWARGEGTFSLCVGFIDENGRRFNYAESQQYGLGKEWRRFVFHCLCDKGAVRLAPAIYIYKTDSMVYMDDVSFSESSIAPLFMNRGLRTRVLPDAWVYRGGKAKVAIEVSSPRAAEGVLTVTAESEDGGLVTTLHSSTVSVPRASALVIDDLDDVAFPDARPQVPTLWGKWKASEAGKDRTLTLFNTSRYPEKPKHGVGSLLLKFRGGDGGVVKRVLDIPVKVSKADRLSFAVCGIGRIPGRFGVTLRGKDKDRKFVYSAGGVSGDLRPANALTVNSDEWKVFDLPIRDFIPWPKTVEGADESPSLNEITSVEFVLGTEPLDIL